MAEKKESLRYGRSHHDRTHHDRANHIHPDYYRSGRGRSSQGSSYDGSPHHTNPARFKEEEFDLLVIGGGITGAGILWDAVNRGLKAILVEKGDFASGTSSRSTKLIHGGLRYLEQLEFGLVKEVGREREILYHLAPHLVHPEKMLLPLIKGGKLTPLTASVGIWLYDRLAGVKRDERRRMLSKEETLALVPQLDPEKVVGGALYVEYRTDDARLTIEVLKSAVDKGALAMNYAEVTGLLYDEKGKVTGVRLYHHRTGEELILHAKTVVNAAGPWVDFIRKMDGSLEGKRIHWSKGVHLVFDQSHFPLTQSIYFDTPDGRMIFAIPREGKTYVGTTDTDYKGNPGMPDISEEDKEYLLGAVNHLFPSLKLTKEEIESGWAGIRPLIHEEGKEASEISRKDEIFLSPSGLITIAGGKLTAFRKMAERTVDLICKRLRQIYGVRCAPCMTKGIPLSGSSGGMGLLKEIKREIKDLGINSFALSPERVEELFLRYGENVREIYRMMEGLRERNETGEAIYPPFLYDAKGEGKPLLTSDWGRGEETSNPAKAFEEVDRVIPAEVDEKEETPSPAEVDEKEETPSPAKAGEGEESHDSPKDGGEEEPSVLTSPDGRKGSPPPGDAHGERDEAIPLDLLAELRYAWEKEYVYTPADFLIRRTGLHFFHRSYSLTLFPHVLAYLSAWNHWSEEQSSHWNADKLQ